MIATPLTLSTIIGLAFGGLSGGDVPVRDIPIALVNRDRGERQGAVLECSPDHATCSSHDLPNEPVNRQAGYPHSEADNPHGYSGCRDVQLGVIISSIVMFFLNLPERHNSVQSSGRSHCENENRIARYLAGRPGLSAVAALFSTGPMRLGLVFKG
jgi:hypothetical protein